MENMLCKRSLIIGIVILFIGAGVVSGLQASQPHSVKNSGRGNTIYVGGAGPGNYSSIQAGINAASNGDTVFVYNDSSPYHEDLIVDKSINLLGEYRNTTIIDGGGGEVVVNVTADNVTMSEFTIQYSNNSKGRPLPPTIGYWMGLPGHQTAANLNIIGYDIGIIIVVGDHHTVKNCKLLSNNIVGISVGGPSFWCEKNNISSNFIQDSLYGILIGGIDGVDEENKISNNTIVNCADGLALIDNSTKNKVHNNTILDGESCGIYLYGSSNNNLIYDNVLDNNGNTGISVLISCQGNDIRRNDIYNGGEGIDMYESSLNNMNNNTIHNNMKTGISLAYSQQNLISDNTIIFNEYNGVTLSESSDDNVISSNNIRNNNFDGINLYKATNNEIRNNNISQNIMNGLSLLESSGNTITENWVVNNGRKGIWINSGNKNHIVNNYFDNTDNAQDDGANNFWAIQTITNGLNICGGSRLGGNYWSDYTIDSLPCPPWPFYNVYNVGPWHPAYTIPGTANSADIHPIPGFELLVFIAAFAIALIILRTRKSK